MIMLMADDNNDAAVFFLSLASYKYLIIGKVSMVSLAFPNYFSDVDASFLLLAP
jgi:hypothetical protein